MQPATFSSILETVAAEERWRRLVRDITWTPPTSTEIGVVVKSALAAGLAWWLAVAITDVPSPVLAPMTALVVVQVSVRASARIAIQRSGAVVVGVLVALGVGNAISLNGFTVAVLVAASLAIAQLLLRLPPSAARQVPISVLFVLAAASTRESFGWLRTVDTLIGALVGVTVSLVLPASRVVDAAQTLARLVDGLGGVLTAMGSDLREPWHTEQSEEWRRTARTVRDRLVDQATEAIGTGREVARWNVRDRRHVRELARYEEVLPRFERSAINVWVIARTLDAHARLGDHPSAHARARRPARDVGRRGPRPRPGRGQRCRRKATWRPASTTSPRNGNGARHERRSGPGQRRRPTRGRTASVWRRSGSATPPSSCRSTASSWTCAPRCRHETAGQHRPLWVRPRSAADRDMGAGDPMNIVVALGLIVVACASSIAAMLLVRRRAPDGGYFNDGDRAAGVFGVLATGFSVLLGFVVFLAFTSYDVARSGAEAEARTVAQQVQTATLLSDNAAGELIAGLVCYARSVAGVQWERMQSGTLGEEINPWGVALYHTIEDVEPETTSRGGPLRQVARPDRERELARQDRVHGAAGVIPTPLWIVLFFITAIIFVFMLFFADSGERAVVQALLIGSVSAVIAGMLVLLYMLDHPFHDGLGGLEPVAMERTLEIIDQELEVTGLEIELPCDEVGEAL